MQIDGFWVISGQFGMYSDSIGSLEDARSYPTNWNRFDRVGYRSVTRPSA